MTHPASPLRPPRSPQRGSRPGRSPQRGLIGTRSPQRGLMLVGLLIIMIFTSLLATRGMEVWATTRQREREAELLFVGNQYRQAIRQYYFSAPGGQARMLPASLEDLLDDKRSPVPLRHLRRLYADPITGSNDWGLSMRGDRIAGVYSKSEDLPMKQAGFETANAGFEGRQTYREWAFLFVPPVPKRR